MTDKQAKYTTAEPADKAKPDEKALVVEEVRLQILWTEKQKEQFAVAAPKSAAGAPGQKYRRLRKYER